MKAVTSLNMEIRQLLKEKGVSLVGFGDLQALPASERCDLPYGVSLAIALDPEAVKGIKQGPTMAYWKEYQRLNELLDAADESLAEFIRMRGFQAMPLTRSYMTWDREQYQTFLPHKTVATRAGLGWIGKCALLITWTHGPMVRISSVLTDAPLDTARPVNESLCGNCNVCVLACPGKAVSGNLWEPGMKREEFFDAFACARTCESLCKSAGIEDSICGRCIYVCPYTKEYMKSQHLVME